MSESDAIEQSARPATTTSLLVDLRQLGVRDGMTLMVHPSLSRLGYVSGGAQAVVTALCDAVGEAGTLMMPTHSGDLSDPASWSNPPVPESWWETLRQEMPAYDPQITPTRAMGAVVECFRHLPGVRRSAHPTVSAAAVGPNARGLIEGHELEFGLGESSPQARLYELDGHILLLGVTHSNNTSLHLSEYRAAPADPATTTDWSPVSVDGQRAWVSYANFVDDDSDFEQLGNDFAATGLQVTAAVGAGQAHLMRARDLVDFGVDWMSEHRAMHA